MSIDSCSGISAEHAGCTVGALRAQIRQTVTNVRERAPLAQSFTNFVTINLVANAQLAAGGIAAMSFLPDDVIATSRIAGSNYINMGTLLPSFRDVPQERHDLGARPGCGGHRRDAHRHSHIIPPVPADHRARQRQRNHRTRRHMGSCRLHGGCGNAPCGTYGSGVRR